MDIEENMAIALRRGEKRTLRWGVSRHRILEYSSQVLCSLMLRQARNIRAVDNNLTGINGPYAGNGIQRGEKRTLRWGVSREDRELFREKLQTLGLGLEDRMTSKVGLLSGGQRQAITLLMAALKQPKLLLLDEHTAALDPKTAAKVLEISDKIIAENQLTAMMVTHNMKDAIVHGNRLIMMHEGKVIYDVAGEEKKNLQVKDLLAKFEEVSGGEFANDRMMLA